MPPKKGRCKLHLNPPAVGGGFVRHAGSIREIIARELEVPPNTVDVLYDTGLVAEITTPTIPSGEDPAWPEGRFERTFARALRDIYEDAGLHHPSADHVRFLFEPQVRDRLEVEPPPAEPLGPEQKAP